MDEALPSAGRCLTSLAWLRQRLGLGDDGTSQVERVWRDLRKAMGRAPGGQFIDEAHWPSDYWIARGTQHTFLGTVAPVWDPPQHVDEWPTFASPEKAPGGARPQPTNHLAFRDALEAVQPIPASRSSASLHRFVEMPADINASGDIRKVQVGHVLAWLATALGSLFMDVPFTEAERESQLTDFARTRLRQARAIQPAGWAVLNEFEDRRLDAIYNARITDEAHDRVAIALSVTRTGQSVRWSKHWRFLSHDIGAPHTLEALDVAAGLLTCDPLVDALHEAVGSEDVVTSRIALAVLRRWMLSLAVMAWLDAALRRSWVDVRPEDLACFAFAAMRPEWPRRQLAVSHRSKDAKPRLIEMGVWESAHCAIDATYVPSWETNTGMVWGLFAAVPAIGRVRSAHYPESEWCRREIEITQYLIDTCDFMSGRVVTDVTLADIEVLDRLLVAPSPSAGHRGENPSAPAPAKGARKPLRETQVLAEFPPLAQLWRVPELPVWEVDMMRAGAMLRLLNCVSPSPHEAHRLAQVLMVGGDASRYGQPPIATPGGWRDYADVLRKAARRAPGRALPVSLPTDYGAQALDRQRFAPMRHLEVPAAFADVLLASEWLRVEWTWMASQNLGDLLLVDCQGVARDAWEAEDSYALMRGLTAFPDLPMPLWVLQSATQGVEHWRSFAADRPIFTRHDKRQFHWMMGDNVVDRAEARRRYAELSGLTLCAELHARCCEPNG